VWIGAGETKAINYVSKATKRLFDFYPNIKVHFLSGDAALVKEKLDNGLLDFGLVISPTNNKKYEMLRLPVKDTWGILLSDKHPLAKKEKISPKDLADNISIFTSQQSIGSNEISEWLGTSLDNFHFSGSYNLLYNASFLAEENAACIFALDGIVNTNDRGLKFLPLEPSVQVDLNFIWKKNQPLSKAANKFLEILNDVITNTYD